MHVYEKVMYGIPHSFYTLVVSQSWAHTCCSWAVLNKIHTAQHRAHRYDFCLHIQDQSNFNACIIRLQALHGFIDPKKLVNSYCGPVWALHNHIWCLCGILQFWGLWNTLRAHEGAIWHYEIYAFDHSCMSHTEPVPVLCSSFEYT